MLELARCEFLLRRENVLLLGNSGTGKTHLALALGLSACQHGHRVRFTTAAAMVHELLEARDEKRLLRYQKQMAGYEPLIVDELGFVPLSNAYSKGTPCLTTFCAALRSSHSKSIRNIRYCSFFCSYSKHKNDGACVWGRNSATPQAALGFAPPCSTYPF